MSRPIRIRQRVMRERITVVDLAAAEAAKAEADAELRRVVGEFGRAIDAMVKRLEGTEEVN